MYQLKLAILIDPLNQPDGRNKREEKCCMSDDDDDEKDEDDHKADSKSPRVR